MRFLLCAALSVFAAGAALAQAETKAERVITVNGTATVYAKPDTARIYYGIRASEPSADAVKDVLTKNIKAIDESYKKLKIAEVSVTSAPIAIKHSSGGNGNLAVPVAPGGAPAAAGLGPFVGFTSQTATIVNSDPEKLRADVDAFVKTITEAGANTSGGEPRETNINIFPGQSSTDGPKVVLSRADDSAARDEALQKAVEKAVRNAKAIAKGLGVGDVKVISVTDVEPEPPAPEPLTSIYGLEAPSAPKSPAGVVEVKVRVVVKCSY
jgi:uncharacterized protein YggE